MLHYNHSVKPWMAEALPEWVCRDVPVPPLRLWHDAWMDCLSTMHLRFAAIFEPAAGRRSWRSVPWTVIVFPSESPITSGPEYAVRCHAAHSIRPASAGAQELPRANRLHSQAEAAPPRRLSVAVTFGPEAA